ncbi:MAG: MmcQ/YjbR family DNA-binding protein [Candidatus Limnocylindria bacterium]
MTAKPHAALRKKLLTYALSLPEAEEHHPWCENVAKVRGKIFFFGGRPENDFVAGLKLPLSRSAALRLPGAEPMGYGMGAHDWVTIRGEVASKVDLYLIRVWIRESYCAVAPKWIAALLDPPAGGSISASGRRTAIRRS